MNIQDGQCGLCTHFGEEHPTEQKLVQLRETHQASDAVLDDCGHPKHAALHLKVTANSGCDGFQPATN